MFTHFNIIHGDLKLKNMMIRRFNKDGSEKIQLVIIDFDCCIVVNR